MALSLSSRDNFHSRLHVKLKASEGDFRGLRKVRDTFMYGFIPWPRVFVEDREQTSRRLFQNSLN